MSNKFGGSTQGELNLDDGTTPIFASTLGAASFTASSAVKTGPTGLLVSSDLDVSDVTGLASDLVLKDELSFVTGDTHTAPAAGQVKIYFKTDGVLYKKDPAGNEIDMDGTNRVSRDGDTMSGNLVVDEANIELSTNGTHYLSVDANSSGTSFGKTELRYNYLRLITSDATGNELAYIGHTPGVGMLQNVQETTSSHRFAVAGTTELQVDDTDVTIASNNLLVEGGNVEVTGTNKTITIESGSDSAAHSKDGITYTHNSGNQFNYVVDTNGVDFNLTNSGMSYAFEVDSNNRMTISDNDVKIDAPALLLDDVTTRSINLATSTTPANICNPLGTYPNTTYGAQTMNIESGDTLGANRVVSYMISSGNIAVKHVVAGSEESVASSRPLGVTLTSATSGAIVPVALSGIIRIEVDSSCTPEVGALVLCTGTDGRVICGSNIPGSNTVSIGICMESPGAVSAGYYLLVHLRGQTEAY